MKLKKKKPPNREKDIQGLGWGQKVGRLPRTKRKRGEPIQRNHKIKKRTVQSGNKQTSLSKKTA